MPQDFDRPSFFISFESSSVNQLGMSAYYEESAAFQIAVFTEESNQNKTSLETANKIRDSLAEGYLFSDDKKAIEILKPINIHRMYGETTISIRTRTFELHIEEDAETDKINMLHLDNFNKRKDVK